MFLCFILLFEKVLIMKCLKNILNDFFIYLFEINILNDVNVYIKGLMGFFLLKIDIIVILCVY